MGAYGGQNSPPETSLAPESSFLIQSLRSIMTTGASLRSIITTGASECGLLPDESVNDEELQARAVRQMI